MSDVIHDYFANADDIIRVGGLMLVLLLIYLETGVFLGMFLPGGDYMLFATGIFCGTNFFNRSYFLVLLYIIIASILGDTTGYIQGKWLGKRLFMKNNSRVFRKEYLVKSNRFYTKYGGWAFIVGRFTPFVRTFIPMLAGASGFHFKRFILYDTLGGIIWVSSIVSIGYYFGKEFPQVIDYSLYILMALVIIASLGLLKLLVHKK